MAMESKWLKFFFFELMPKIIWLVALSIGIMCFYYSTNVNTNKTSSFISSPNTARLNLTILNKSKHPKWIVVTTIAPPTDDVIFLAKLEDWKMVVVGDTKTPAGWSYPNVDYLDIAAQESLGFRTADVTPYQSYTRKNIGYLYAIARGAQVIYETDDDNRPLDRLATFCQSDVCPGLVFAGPNLFNPYKHFGQPTLWPRGFPLGEVAAVQPTEYRLFNNNKSPLIQQGLVNGDPDMDAIFRLTRKYPLAPLDVTFDPAAPPALLPEGVFSAFNSQNTLFHRDAFWALMLPSTTSFRMCDIWRGYWAQRLLWEIGGHLGFFAPNAHQIRNSHSYMADAVDEKDMYYNTDRLIAFLRAWDCPVHLRFFECVQTLSESMADQHFWGKGDTHVTKVWLSDLLQLGYTEPVRIDIQTITNDLSKSTLNSLKNESLSIEIQRSFSLDNGSYVNFLPANQLSPSVQPKAVHKSTKAQLLAQIISVCTNFTIDHKTVPNNNIQLKHNNITSIELPKPETFLNMNASVEDMVQSGFNQAFHNILLIVISNNIGWLPQSLPYLEIMHRNTFPNIVYCSNDPNGTYFKKAADLSKQISFIHADIDGANTRGGTGYLCFTQAVAMHFNVKGYLVVNDDTLIKTWNFLNLDQTKVWKDSSQTFFNCSTGVHGWQWWRPNKDRYQLVISDLITGAKKGTIDSALNPIVDNIDVNKCCSGSGDTYYIPTRFSKSAAALFKVMGQRDIFLEIAIPTVNFWIGGEKDVVHINDTTFWDDRRFSIPERKSYLVNDEKRSQFFHPFKFSDKINRRLVCEQFIGELMRRT